MLRSPAEYLDAERPALEKHEYHAGRTWQMPSRSRWHSAIVTNLFGSFAQAVDTAGGVLLALTMRTKVSERGLYTYPDAVILFDKPELEDDFRDTLLNPAGIIEVYSPRTEAWDRGTKFAHYQLLPSLREYILMAETEPRIEIFSRAATGGGWHYRSYTGFTATADLPRLSLSLFLSDVYDRIEFPPPSPPFPPLTGSDVIGSQIL